MKFQWYCSIQESSKAKMRWSIGTYERWHGLRAQIHSDILTATWTQNNRLIPPIHEVVKCIPDMKHGVCDFIVEICKENGAPYPRTSLYDLLQGLSMYLEHEHKFENKLMSGAFCKI